MRVCQVHLPNLVAPGRGYRSKLTDLWTAAYNNELQEVHYTRRPSSDTRSRRTCTRHPAPVSVLRTHTTRSPCASRLGQVTTYIESGADPNSRSQFFANRETPLHDAVLGGHLQMVRGMDRGACGYVPVDFIRMENKSTVVDCEQQALRLP